MANKIYLGNINISTSKFGSGDTSMYIGATKVYPTEVVVRDYFTIVALENGSVTWSGSTNANTLSYSKDGGQTWTTTDRTTTINVSSGDTVMFKGTCTPSGNSGIGRFSSTSNYNIKGNLMSLSYGDSFESQTSVRQHEFHGLFQDSTKLIYADELEVPATTLATACYDSLLRDCTNLLTAPEFPATTMANTCYSCMLQGTSITTAPALPATTLAPQCYYGLFERCTGLTEAPLLPATSVTSSAYNYMFQYASNLSAVTCLALSGLGSQSSWMNGVAATGVFTKDKNASWTAGNDGIPIGWTVKNYFVPEFEYLTFEALESGTFKFSGNSVDYSLDNGATWTSLGSNTASPTVNSGETIMFKAQLSPGQYKGVGKFSSTGRFNAMGNTMSLLYGDNFSGQTSLTGKAFALYNLFGSCSGLINAENLVLPATTLDSQCYTNMFFYCSSLTAAPALPATTLANNCYYGMFYGCSSLTAAPSLPATTLDTSCYNQMFCSCTSLTTAPVLSAATLLWNCYCNMFNGCSNLSSITCLATDISANSCTNNWVYGVAASGTFIKAEGMNGWSSGNNGIPNGWAEFDINIKSYLKFNAKSSGTIGWSGTSTSNTLSYSTDSGSTWSTPSDTLSVSVASGDTVMFKGTCTQLTSSGSEGIGRFSGTTAQVEVKGNIMSLLYGDNFSGQTSLSGKNLVFHSLFKSCTSLTNAEYMLIPSSTIPTQGCQNMFYGCSGLTAAPQLIATTLGEHAYIRMFEGCTSLTSAPPTLPASSLTYQCYYSMFADCTSLATAPSIEATSLSGRSCMDMFKNCTSLEESPTLKAQTLANECYFRMFSGCTSLSGITCLATDISATNCTYSWVSGVANSGTFTKAAGFSNWTSGVNGIPTNWTVQEPSSTTDYLTFEYLEGGSLYFDGNGNLEYSVNGGSWETFYFGSFNQGDVVRFRGNITSIKPYGDYGIGHFEAYGGSFNAKGTPASLIYGDNYADYADVTTSYCYKGLFRDCNALIDASEMVLSAPVLAEGCYYEMFKDCRSLSGITCLATDISAIDCTYSWVSGVNHIGTFTKAASMTSWNIDDDSGVPMDWTVQDYS